jgi:biotin transporter BioY
MEGRTAFGYLLLFLAIAALLASIRFMILYRTDSSNRNAGIGFIVSLFGAALLGVVGFNILSSSF